MLISGDKMLMSVELKACVTRFIYFLDVFLTTCNFVKFHHCRVCVTDFREGEPFYPLSVSSLKKDLRPNFCTEKSLFPQGF